MSISVDEIAVADPADAWMRAGFTVDSDAVCRVGGVRIRLAGTGAAPAATSDTGAAPAATSDTGAGIVGWSLRGLPPDGSPDSIDGIPTTRSERAFATPAEHPNGVTAIDHVVLMSPHLDRTVAALAAVGAQPRRQRDAALGGQPIRQLFFRFGEVILEVVGSPDAATDTPSTLWGITYVVDDIDATAAFLGDRTTPVKDAVQPGRRITTLRHRDLGMSVPTAMISASR
ncbi:glyoxalase [Mycolicibacterium moriokaense]|nr:glyoxalase [Mycolicibacterium moriokaense]